MLASNGERLNFLYRVAPGGGITRMPDRARAYKFPQHILAEDVRDKALGPKLVQIGTVARYYPASLLPTVLLSEQTQLSKGGRFSVSINAEDAALFVKFIRKDVHHQYFNRAGAPIARDGNDIFSMLPAPLRGL